MKHIASILTITFLAANSLLTAQTQPTDDRKAGEYSSPFWVGDGGVSGDLLLEGPRAAARETAAQWRYRFHKVEFEQEIARIVGNYRDSELYVRARNDLKAARLTHDAARQRVLAQLMSLPAFAASVHLHTRLSEQIADERANAKPDAARISALAQMRVDTIAANRAAEAQALASDADYQSAREQLQRAAQKLDRLEAELRTQVRNDADLIAMRRESRELKIEHLTAEAYRDGVRFLARDAAAYSLSLRDADRRTLLFERGYIDQDPRYDLAGWSWSR